MEPVIATDGNRSQVAWYESRKGKREPLPSVATSCR
jgi:hypothetical protein